MNFLDNFENLEIQQTKIFVIMQKYGKIGTILYDLVQKMITIWICTVKFGMFKYKGLLEFKGRIRWYNLYRIRTTTTVKTHLVVTI